MQQPPIQYREIAHVEIDGYHLYLTQGFRPGWVDELTDDGRPRSETYSAEAALMLSTRPHEQVPRESNGILRIKCVDADGPLLAVWDMREIEFVLSQCVVLDGAPADYSHRTRLIARLLTEAGL